MEYMRWILGCPMVKGDAIQAKDVIKDGDDKVDKLVANQPETEPVPVPEGDSGKN